MNIGRTIRTIRLMKNFSQEFMAETLGISKAAYSRLEHSENKISVDKLIEIGTIFELNLNEIINFDQESVFEKSSTRKV